MAETVSAVRVTWVGLVWNLVLTSFKFTAGFVGHSPAMIADAVHSVSDFATDIVVLAGLRFSGRPVDKSHDYGHGKFETMAATVIGAVLLLVGAGVFWAGATRIWACIGGQTPEAPGRIALAAAFVSIVVKEGLYRYTVSAGKRINSRAVIANAWHHRSDALSSVGTMFGIGGAIFLGEKWRVLDPVAAVIVSVFIVKAAYEILSGCLGELIESSLDDKVEAEIIGLAKSVPGVADPHNLRTRRIGRDIAVDLHIRVDGGMQVREAHGMSSTIEGLIRRRFGKSSFVSIHIEPLKTEDQHP
ncbi:MAG: cation diffusion facilitator family transporter [Candidatus Fermentibacteraceae bacterium]